jgi:hypothetical protein
MWYSNLVTAKIAPMGETVRNKRGKRDCAYSHIVGRRIFAEEREWEARTRTSSEE